MFKNTDLTTQYQSENHLIATHYVALSLCFNRKKLFLALHVTYGIFFYIKWEDHAKKI